MSKLWLQRWQQAEVVELNKLKIENFVTVYNFENVFVY